MAYIGTGRDIMPGPSAKWHTLALEGTCPFQCQYMPYGTWAWLIHVTNT